MPQPLSQPDVHTINTVALQKVHRAVEEGNKRRFTQLTKKANPADLADIIESLSKEQREVCVTWLADRFDGDVLAQLDDAVREELFPVLDNKEYARAIEALESDDAVHLVESLEDTDQQKVLAQLAPKDRVLIEQSLTYPEDSAGRLMQREVVTIPQHWNVGQTIDFMRDPTNDMPESFYDIFVVNAKMQVVGQLAVSQVLRHRRNRRIKSLMGTDLHPIPVGTDQEDVAHLFRQYGLVAAPVVDQNGRLLGHITFDDVVEVIDEEAEEDLMRLGGVESDDLYRDVYTTTSSRFQWLGLNLLTAIVASLVIAQFSGVIEKMVALAVLMPVVASMAGNAGTQALTVAVRAIAMRELSAANAMRIIIKEVMVGAINGVFFAVLTGSLAYFWYENLQMTYVIAASTFFSLIIANFAGVTIPLVLARSGVDPAIASGVFLTTATDVIAFFSFLGLAALYLA